MYEKYMKLVKAISDSGDAEFEMDLLKDSMAAFPTYVNSVYNEAVMTPILRFTLEGEDLQDKVKNLDERRRLAHNSAINACNIINRMCDSHNVERVCIDAETCDRYMVADFCAEVVVEVFHQGKTKKIDKLIEELTKAVVY